MRRTHPQSHVTLQYCGRVTSKKRCISTFTRLTMRGPHPQSHVTHSRDKSETLYLHLHETYGPYLTLAGWWLRMSEPHPQSQMTLQLCGHVTNQKYFIFIFTRRKAHNLSRVVTRMRRPHLTCHVRPWSCHHVTTI